MNRSGFLRQFNFSYINGEDVKVPNAFDVGLNALFVSDGVRSGFIIQDIDYKNKKTYQKLLKLVLTLPNLMSIKLWVGDLIVSDPNIAANILENPSDENIGRVINYPCYEDYNVESKTKYSATIYIEGNDMSDIMANVCNSERKAQKIYTVKNKMQKYIDHYRVGLRLKAKISAF